MSYNVGQNNITFSHIITGKKFAKAKCSETQQIVIIAIIILYFIVSIKDLGNNQEISQNRNN